MGKRRSSPEKHVILHTGAARWPTEWSEQHCAWELTMNGIQLCHPPFPTPGSSVIITEPRMRTAVVRMNPLKGRRSDLASTIRRVILRDGTFPERKRVK